jgi:acyl-CoA thioesterase I
VNPESEPNRIRIVALGDSTTAGTPGWLSPLEAPPDGAGDETSQYPYWLMRERPAWQVLNRGVNGQRSDEIAARFDRDAAAANPAVVVIIAGVNDVYQGRAVAHVTGHLRGMYKRAAQAGIAVVAGTIVPYNTATPDQNARMREINEWIRTQSESCPIVFVDTRAAVASPSNADLLFDSPDQLHPTPGGYRRMADAIKPAIDRLLTTR